MGRGKLAETSTIVSPRAFSHVAPLLRDLAACDSVDQMLAVLADGLAPLLPVRDRVSIVFRDPDGELMRIYRVLPRFDGPVGELPRVHIEGTPVGQVVREGVGRITDIRTESVITLGHASRDRIRSTISVPIRVGGEVVGALNAGAHAAGTCTEAMLAPLEELASWIGPAVFATDQMLTGAQPRVEIDDDSRAGELDDGGLIGRSPAFVRMLTAARRAAPSDADVLITGETGVGKTALARAIHRWSPRHDGPFVTVQIADLASTIVESELFGHERGAFTGALATRIGRFESADGGTIFLDEIGEAPLAIQAKLLRVIQERRFERVGGGKTINANVRIIAATSRDLRELVASQRFRADLFYRLDVVPLEVPPLRERREDLDLLVESLLRRFGGDRDLTLSDAAWKRVRRHEWPGNIRELESVIKRASILEEGARLELEDLIERSNECADCDGDAGWLTLDEHQKAYIERAIERCGGIIEGPSGAAELLGLRPSTLRSRMGRLGISARAIRKRGNTR